MRIVCISDTHVPSGMGKLPPALYEALKGADLIIHAGDLTSPDIIEELGAYAPVEAVVGNMDGADLAETLPDGKVINAGGLTIAIAHGSGPPEGIEDRLLEKYRPGEIDILVYGHSHNPNIERRSGVLLVNPGSPTDKRWAPYTSYAVINILDEGVGAEIIKL